MFRTLRSRLAAAMLAILLLAVAGSVAMKLLSASSHAAAGPDPDEEFIPEPYQDTVVLAAFAIPALLLIWLVSSWSLRPILRVSREAAAIGPANPAARLSEAGLPAEILPLVNAVNGALDRMAGAMAAEHRFTENAAHELRTPLTVLGLRLQRARRAGQIPDWQEIEQDLARMNRLVAQLLDLARREHEGRIQAERLPVVNLARICREAAAAALPLAEEAGRDINIDLPEILQLRGKAEDLREAISALLENAVRHGAGTIGLSGQCDTITGKLRLAITDQGPGIPAMLRDSVFERFQKGQASQGTGLGLAIVREVARSHGGSIAFAPGPTCRAEMILSACTGGPAKEGVLF